MAEDITLEEKLQWFDAAQAPELTELTAIRMLPSMVEVLHEIARDLDWPVAWVICRAIEEYAERWVKTKGRKGSCSACARPYQFVPIGQRLQSRGLVKCLD
jgi:hypothetical protein